MTACQLFDEVVTPLDQHVHVPHIDVFLLDLIDDEAEEGVGVHRDYLVNEALNLEVLDVHLVNVFELFLR